MSEAELPILQAVRLKGRIARAELAETVGAEPTVDALIATGLLLDGVTLRLTADGRTRLAELLATERAAVDAAAADDVYRDFGVVNAELKPVISQWQLAKGSPDEEQAAAETLERVEALHRAVRPVIAAASGLVPRLGVYAERLDGALERAKAGDMAWLTRPMVDSYHTVWFELHEELIGMAGRTRSDEA